LVHAPNGELAAQTRQLSSRAVAELGLSGDRQSAFERVLEDLATTFEHAPPDSRFLSYERADAELRKVLGPELHEKFKEFVTAWVQRAQLG
jgi:hypothetical protein